MIRLCVLPTLYRAFLTILSTTSCAASTPYRVLVDHCAGSAALRALLSLRAFFHFPSLVMTDSHSWTGNTGNLFAGLLGLLVPSSRGGHTANGGPGFCCPRLFDPSAEHPWEAA